MADLVWWSLDNPAGGRIIEALCNGECIGHTTLSYRKLGGGVYGQLGHHVIAEPYRGRSIFSRMVERCEAEAASKGVAGLLITPNNRSSVIYKHWGYDFHHEETSSLFLIDPIPVGESDSIRFLDLEDYIAATRNMPRLCEVDTAEISWRFSRPGAHYRFVALRHGEQDAFLSFRNGFPGPIRVFVLSEIFLQGKKPPLAETQAMISTLCKRIDDPDRFIVQHFADTAVPPSGTERYRALPFVLKSFDQSPRSPDFYHYQLSDTDYG